MIVELRSHDERWRDGVIPGSVHVPHSVLEWRVDPDSGFSNPHVTDRALELNRQGFPAWAGLDR